MYNLLSGNIQCSQLLSTHGLHLIPGQKMQYAYRRGEKIKTELEEEDQEVVLCLKVTFLFELLYLFGISYVF